MVVEELEEKRGHPVGGARVLAARRPEGVSDEGEESSVDEGVTVYEIKSWTPITLRLGRRGWRIARGFGDRGLGSEASFRSGRSAIAGWLWAGEALRVGMPQISKITQINCLVRKKPIRDVTMRECRGGDDGGVLDANAVVNFVSLFQSTAELQSYLRLSARPHRSVETPLQSGIFLNIFLVFVKRGRADTTEFTAGQRRLQHVRRVDCAFRRAGPDERMKFIDKKNDLTLRVFDFFQDGL